jgi:hypothetical protein
VILGVAMPTFIIGGAPKCGTTALWGMLNEHPEVFMSQIKEPRFFTRARSFGEGIVRPGPERPIVYERGLDWYQALFDATASIRGEASTLYLGAPDAAELIHRHIPDARLVFLLRDPAARLYSHYWQDHKSGIDLEPFELMMSKETPEFRFYALLSAYRVLLARYLATFPRHQVLVLLHDDLRHDPQPTFRKVCRFIGADPTFVPRTLDQAYNPHSTPRSRGLARLSVRLQHAKGTQRLPPGLRRSLGRLRGWLGQVNARPANYPPLPRHLRARLVERFEVDTTFVEELLGVELPHWRAVGDAR